MALNSFGLIELTSIAAGFEVCDATLKAADVRLLHARITKDYKMKSITIIRCEDERWKTTLSVFIEETNRIQMM